MAGILDFLTSSIVPKRAVSAVQDFIDDPSQEDRGMVRPFMAGAVEGLASLATPLDLAGAALGGQGISALNRFNQAAKAVPEVTQGLQRAFRPVASIARDTFGIPEAAGRRLSALQTPLEGAGNLKGSTGWGEFDVPRESFPNYSDRRQGPRLGPEWRR